jgi:hypothetical protein
MARTSRKGYKVGPCDATVHVGPYTTNGKGAGGGEDCFRGAPTTLHSFDGADGSTPLATLVQGANGTFYGITLEGRTNGQGTVFSLSVNP